MFCFEVPESVELSWNQEREASGAAAVGPLWEAARRGSSGALAWAHSPAPEVG